MYEKDVLFPECFVHVNGLHETEFYKIYEDNFGKFRILRLIVRYLKHW